jgi:hypothetical protein
MSQCECGCGEEAIREFLSSDDQKLRVALEARVGGLLAMKLLVETAESYANGDLSDSELTRRVRAVFSAAWRKKT